MTFYILVHLVKVVFEEVFAFTIFYSAVNLKNVLFDFLRICLLPIPAEAYLIISDFSHPNVGYHNKNNHLIIITVFNQSTHNTTTLLMQLSY